MFDKVLDKADLEKLASVADELDAKGLTAQADAIEVLLRTAAEEAEEKKPGKNGLNGKATKALQSLMRALESFTSKNLDSRGPARRTMNKCVDTAEDLLTCCKECLGGK